MNIELASVLVENQARALAFYSDVLGFQLKVDIPLGGDARWLTVVSPNNPDGAALLLEPNSNPAAQTFQKAMRDQGIPLTAFAVDDIDAEHKRLTASGVEFTMAPTNVGTAWIAVFDDTCGNLIQLYQEL